jgi:phosphoribosyl 1,2-cyclic phosphodiesterase
LRIACLGSGSRGNSVLVEAGATTILVDAGFSGAEIERRLERLGVVPTGIAAVVVTHEHRDHTGGIGIAARRWGWPLHLTRATASACATLLRGDEEIVLHERDAVFQVGDLSVRLVPTCHDASDPVAVHLTCAISGLRAGVATDIGRATAPVRDAFRECHFLVLEANHDEVRLREAPYPWSVKQRIGGSRGHLSNRLAGELAVELHHEGLGGILLAHLSKECNEARQARTVVERALRAVRFRGRLEVAAQDEPSAWFDVRRLAARAADGGPQLSLWWAERTAL